MPILLSRLFQVLCLIQVVLTGLSKLKFDEELSKFIDDNHTGWVVFFGVVLSLAIFESVLRLFAWITGQVSEKIYSRKLIKIVRTLKHQDKSTLSKFISENKYEIFLHAEDTSAEWLSSNKIIIRTGTSLDKKVGYKLAIWARDYLTRNPNLLY